MPFRPNEPGYGPLALPEYYKATPEARDVDTSLAAVMGAAFRRENPVVSAVTSYRYDPLKPFDPEYDPWEDIQGTQYESFAGRFAGARDREDVLAVQAQIDREWEDRATLQAAGAWGILPQFAAALMSPSMLIPGGAIAKGAKGGISIGRTALSVSSYAALAAGLDEAALQGTQETRTGEESAFAIGGSVLLGGLLGGAVGKLARSEAQALARDAEQLLEAQHDYVEAIRLMPPEDGSLSAAQVQRDLSLRREEIFQAVDKIPVLRALVRSDPILRGQLSPNREVRQAVADLVETPLQYRINDEGRSVRGGQSSVETIIRDRERNELAQVMGYLARSFAEYSNDGPVGMVGTLTAPITSRFENLMGKTSKLSQGEFLEEVGKALRRGDKHPIPQVQSAADAIRRTIFDKIKDEATEVGIFDEALDVVNAESYFTRVYDVNRIERHFGDGTADDLTVTLKSEFMKRRQQAITRLEEARAEEAARAEKATEQEVTEKALSKQDEKDQFYAGLDEAQVDEAVRDAIRSIIGLKPGQHSYEATLSSPTRARVLDVADEILEPWLIDDAGTIVAQYFRAMVPDIEISRRFGDVNMSEQIERIQQETMRLAKEAPNEKARAQMIQEGRERVSDLEGMRDRLRNRYGVPENPRSIWVQGGRTARTLSFAGFLGGMTVSAMPDVAGVIGRNGIEAAFGAVDAITDPKRFGVAVREMAEIGAAAEWYLNNRAMSLAELFDPYGQGTRLERALGHVSSNFARATGMIPWNIGWKSVGMAFAASRMAKAADAVARNKASKKQLRMLAENDIEPWMADRIAEQIRQHGDTNGTLWLARGQDWTDREAFDAFRRAMNREADLMVLTPGQDKPLTMSTEAGKFFLQFRSFMMSAHHRILLSGIQRADADVLAQFTTAMILGGLVSNIKADLGGYDRKEGAAFWEDAIDRSGLAGWLFEPYNLASAFSGGRLSVSGEPVSRYQARSQTEGLLGPSVDMGFGVVEGINGFASGKATYRDVRKLMRPIPGNNLVYLLPLFEEVERGIVDMTGAKPRE